MRRSDAADSSLSLPSARRAVSGSPGTNRTALKITTVDRPIVTRPPSSLRVRYGIIGAAACPPRSHLARDDRVVEQGVRIRPVLVPVRVRTVPVQEGLGADRDHARVLDECRPHHVMVELLALLGV